jgi:hypothetical protein
MSRAVAEATLAVLRLMQVLGPMTRKALVARIGECLPFKGKVVQQIISRCRAPIGYLEEDSEGLLRLTAKARRMLTDAAAPPQGPRTIGARPDRWQRYVPVELDASARAGSSDANQLPSRAGNRLYWRDGRVTQLDGSTPA